MSGLTFETISSSCSSSLDRVNDNLEAPMIEAEYWLNTLGRKPVVCLLSGGILRVAFGTIQIIGALFFSAGKLLQAAYYRLRYEREWAELSLNEAGWGCNYILHGIANVVRGVVEACHIFTCCASSDDTNLVLLPYHSENNGPDYDEEEFEQLLNTDDNMPANRTTQPKPQRPSEPASNEMYIFGSPIET